MDIKILEKQDESRWDQFVKENDASTFFHQIGWKNVVEKTYGHKPFYLFAEENGKVTGILPLFLVDSLIFGKRLISVPYSPYGGCCAESQNVTDAILDKAIELSKELNAKYLELRNMKNISGMPTNDKHITMLLYLDQGEKTIWSNISKNMKTCIKKANEEDLNFTFDSKNIQGFYTVHCKRMHELGTPVYPISFFRNIMENFTDMAVATIDHRGEILAGQVLLFFKNIVIYSWGAFLKRFSEAYPSHLLMWKVIQKNIINGYQIFDLGRSAQDSGTYEFKRRFGATPQPLYYQYYLNREGRIPYMHPSNPKYNAAVKTWRTLPLPIANWLGPFVSKELI